MAPEDISKAEQVWNETLMFASDLINPEFRCMNFRDLPQKVREDFERLIGPDIPREAFFTSFQPPT